MAKTELAPRAEVVSGSVVDDGGLKRCKCGWKTPANIKVHAFSPCTIDVDCPECGEGFTIAPAGFGPTPEGRPALLPPLEEE